MLQTQANWRVRPKPHIQRAVEQLAAREDRSVGNMILALVREALTGRGLALGATLTPGPDNRPT
jgi:hypothetical protein